MNILFYLYQFPAFGGIETVTSLWADWFCREGHRIIIISHQAQVPSEFNLSIDSRVLKERMPDIGVSHLNRTFLKEMIKRYRIDVVIFQDSYARIERNLLPLEDDVCVRVITVEHSSPYSEMTRIQRKLSPYEILRRIKFPCCRILRARQESVRRKFLYANSDYYVLLSSRFLGEFRCITKLNDIRKLRFIPNATRPPGYVHESVFPKKEKVIVFMGSLVASKGGQSLLKIWEKIAPVFPDWMLQIVGDGPLRCKMEEQASKLPRICFEGYRSDVFDVFKRASIFAFPSRREGWGLVLVEAMSQGCVPVCFNSFSAIYDIIDDGVNGVIVPYADVDSFADKLQILMADDGTRRQLQVNAVAKAKTFHPENIADQWSVLFG